VKPFVEAVYISFRGICLIQAHSSCFFIKKEKEKEKKRKTQTQVAFMTSQPALMTWGLS